VHQDSFESGPSNAPASFLMRLALGQCRLPHVISEERGSSERSRE
jgi:hypothetical protein